MAKCLAKNDRTSVQIYELFLSDLINHKDECLWRGTQTPDRAVVYGRTGQIEVLADRTGPAIFYGPVLTDQDRTFQ